MGPRHMGNPGRSARVKVDPERLVGDLNRSECDMLHGSRVEVEVQKIPSSKLRCGWNDHLHGMCGQGT